MRSRSHRLRIPSKIYRPDELKTPTETETISLKYGMTRGPSLFTREDVAFKAARTDLPSRTYVMVTGTKVVSELSSPGHIDTVIALRAWNDATTKDSSTDFVSRVSLIELTILTITLETLVLAVLFTWPRLLPSNSSAPCRTCNCEIES